MTFLTTCGTAPIRVGLIGFGAHMAENLYPALRLSPDFRITAISGRDPSRTAAIASQLDIEHSRPSWHCLIDSDLVDCLVVAASPGMHAEVLAAALPAGVHVFVEKPPAPSTQSLSGLAALEAMHRNTVAFVDFNFRYGGILVDIHRQLTARTPLRLAKIRMVASKPLVQMWQCASVEESFLYAVGIHAVDLAVWMFGEPAHVMATRTILGGGRFSLTVTLAFTDGGMAILDLGNYSNRFEVGYELICDDGVARIDDLRQVTFHGFSVGTAPLYSDKETTAYVYPGLKGGFWHSGYGGALQAFADTVRRVNGGDEAIPCLSGVLSTYRIMDRILAAISG